jgi:predicted SAM-dependent methyltransferase
MSETSASRHLLAPYCNLPVLDIGYGGDPILPEAVTFDLVKPYTKVGGAVQMLRGDCRSMPYICDGSFMTVFSSHLVEDFAYGDLLYVLAEWRRILKSNGNLIINAPDQQKFLAHCQATGQGINLAHVEPDFCMTKFVDVLLETGDWGAKFLCPSFGAYSWLGVWEKL